MKRITLWGFMAMVCCIFAAPVYSFASDGTQPFVVVSDLYGSSNFAMSNGDGTLTEQQEIIRFDGNTDDWSYSNGVGDFDNDGALDIILAVGNEAGVVYLYGKIENDQFVEQNTDIQWSRGRYPGKMAVADFDEDGFLDFIMTYDGAIDCDLYKGNGQLEFTPDQLQDMSPQNSIGADAGDFNGDGHADFVSVSYTFGQVYINYGNGQGDFVKDILYLNQYGYGYTSVAAGDFNGDGLDDLVLSHSNYYLSVFLNSGNCGPENDSCGFYWFRYIIDINFDSSPVDTYDLDGDGIQDLIIGGYNNQNPANYSTGITVMPGIGDGTFDSNQPTVYGGATDGLNLITSISAPTLLPAEAVSNIEPVAVLYCDQYEVAAGQAVFIDGQDSYDEDGEIVSYKWDFGDDSPVQEKSLADSLPEESATAEHVYYDVGTYTIALEVTDDQGATGVAELTVTVKPQEAAMRIYPRRLNLKSRGRWMHAWVKLPDGFDATRVTVTSIHITDGSGSEKQVAFGPRGLVVKTRRWLAKRNRFYFKFDRRATIDAISSPSRQTLFRVEGTAYYNDTASVPFEAEDSIRTIKPHKKKRKWHSWKRRWRRGCR